MITHNDNKRLLAMVLHMRTIDPRNRLPSNPYSTPRPKRPPPRRPDDTARPAATDIRANDDFGGSTVGDPPAKPTARDGNRSRDNLKNQPVQHLPPETGISCSGEGGGGLTGGKHLMNPPPPVPVERRSSNGGPPPRVGGPSDLSVGNITPTYVY